MANMQISIRLRRKSGMHPVINALCQILVDHLLYKISETVSFSPSCRIFSVFTLSPIALSRRSLLTFGAELPPHIKNYKNEYSVNNNYIIINEPINKG